MDNEDLHKIIIEEVTAAARCVDIPDNKIEELNETLGHRARLRLGGSSWYMKKADNKERDEEIRRAVVNGQDVRRIAIRYGLSEKRVQQIAHKRED